MSERSMFDFVNEYFDHAATFTQHPMDLAWVDACDVAFVEVHAPMIAPIRLARHWV